MQRPGAAIGVMIAFATLLTTTCSAEPPTADTSGLQSVECPAETVPTELKVTCHRYPRNDGHLAVAVLHAAEATAAPVLVIHGGPGGSSRRRTAPLAYPPLTNPDPPRHDPC